MRPLYIFDLDGTLALIDHRRPILDNKDNPNRWDDFYRACVDDKPNEPIIKILNALIIASGGDIYIFSGRSDLVFKETLIWLHNNLAFTLSSLIDILKMRQHGDSTPDDELKRRWHEELSTEDKERLACVFDDRQKVVDMWRSLGITCLQVAPGDF